MVTLRVRIVTRNHPDLGETDAPAEVRCRGHVRYPQPDPESSQLQQYFLYEGSRQRENPLNGRQSTIEQLLAGRGDSPDSASVDGPLADAARGLPAGRRSRQLDQEIDDSNSVATRNASLEAPHAICIDSIGPIHL
jgi:hypothetical protein